ncbi:ABC transporter permease [Pararhizobium sp. YC-54]|uniref:ABC transporter permease n=1 Tax=Pararhizobium sp. YC-54 TaxID=2986920 RepID=UPI0021F75BDA|nr:ABC transporter permease [Pararhizobium sp. YC-54]MCV9999765.1 ABC transporter permease [Pararhizobium sp. YC-54]
MVYLLKRLAFYLLAAFVAISVNFFLPRLAPGDPASTIIAAYSSSLNATALEALKAAYGVTDAPLITQYFAYLGNLLRGDFGLSLSQFPSSVTSVIAGGIWWSVLLGLVSVTLSFVLGSALGALAAWRRGGFFDRIVPPVLLFLSSFPYFFLALLLFYVLCFRLHWFPMGNAFSSVERPPLTPAGIADILHHLAMPALTIVLVSLGPWALNMRNAMIGVLSEDYLTLAEAKGIPPRRVLLSHAARTALLPNVTALGAAIGGVFSGQILAEIVFTYPGLGYLLLRAVGSVDYPLMQALFLIITLSVLAANFLVDTAYTLLDPRVRAGLEA